MNHHTFHSLASREIPLLLRCGQIGVLPTDTIYGISASALNAKAVERVYDVRNRERDKPFVMLIGSLDDLSLFPIRLSKEIQDLVRVQWPGPVSIVLPCPYKKYRYLHRGLGTMAFRLPAWKPLRALLKKTGPLVSTSANPAGAPPAETIAQAKNYFGNTIDFYVDSGTKKGSPSTLLEYTSGKLNVLRRGAPATPFQERVYAVVAQIPRGSTMTYQEVAKQAGYPGAYRAVGSILKKNYDPRIPCHRVIHEDGTLGEYNRGKEVKKKLLAQERRHV